MIYYYPFYYALSVANATNILNADSGTDARDAE